MATSRDDEMAAAPPGAREFVALAILSVTVGLNTVDRNMFGLLLPQIRQDIAISDTGLGFLMGPAFVIVYSVAGVPIAWLADRAGRRNVIAIGLAFWSLVTVATGFARTMVHLLVVRMLLGVGEASNMAPTSALIGDMFRGRYRVMALAVFSAGGPLSIMLFYPLIGWIAHGHSWRLAYPVMGIAGVLVAIVTFLMVHEPARDGTGPDSIKKTEPVSFAGTAGAVLRSERFLLLCAAGTAFSINYAALTAWFPSFAQRVHGLDAQQVGGLLGTYKGLIGVASAIGGGLLVTWLMRFDLRWLAWAPVLFFLGMVPAQMMLLLGHDPFWWHAGLALETIAMAGITPCLFALLIALVDPQMRATGTAMYLLIFNLIGQGVGPLLVGVLNDGPLASFGADAIRYSLLVAPALAALGALLVACLAFAMHGDPRQAEGGDG
jgi:MFS family permease